MKFEVEYIEKLAKIVNENGLTEILLEDGEQAITVRKEVVVNAAPVQAVAPVATPVAATPAKTEEASAPQHKGQAITSPMVGTFYAAPAVGAEPFVTVGKKIASGDVVCIVEAMKLMNEIESEFSGTITEICVENGQPVEYGQVLMYVE